MRISVSFLWSTFVCSIGVANAHEGAPLRVSWSDESRLVGDMDAVREEVETILIEAGVEVDWAEEAPRPAAWAPRRDVTVVVSPSEPGGDGLALTPAAMGVYLRSEDSSAVFIFYRRVLDVLGLSRRVGRRGGLLTPAERRAIARALGRVIVHELVHRVAPSVAHSAEGVMQARLNRGPLTCGRLRLDDSSKAGLLAAIGKGPVARDHSLSKPGR